MVTEGYEKILEEYAAAGRLRHIPFCDSQPLDAEIIDLCSNDYLGLGGRYNEFLPEFLSRFPDAEFSSSASRLLSSRQKYHSELESVLKDLFNKEILLFNSGYHANVGCITALNIPSTLFVCDKLIHASVVDGLKLGNVAFERFRHNDLSSLRKILDKNTGNFDRIIVVVESIYSMDGDCAPLKEIVELKNDYQGIMIYVDEAHAFGVRGKMGLGLCEEAGLTEKVDIIIGTFGKALASSGAFVATSPLLKDFLINNARSFIFSTALPPVNQAWTLLMIEKMIGMESERKYLEEISDKFRNMISEINPGSHISASQIVPFITGNAEKAVEIATVLRREGILALPIRRPTVPPGGERIRFSLNAGLKLDSLTRVLNVMRQFK